MVRVIHRPGSVQTEIRIGHRGLPRRIDDFHAVSVMSAILGGLFNSRLNMKLREEKGYTYGAGAGFDMRRGAGPFSARAAVNTEVTVPAIVDTLAELDRMRDDAGRRVRARRGARLPHRRLPAPVRDGRAPSSGRSAAWPSTASASRSSSAIAAQIEAVDIDAIAAAAREHLLIDEAAIVLVGDVDAFGADLEAAGLGRIVIERDEVAGRRRPARRGRRCPARSTTRPRPARRPAPRNRSIPGIDDREVDPEAGADDRERPDAG